MNAENSEVDPFRKMRLILELRRAGFTDNRLLNAFERLSREDFLPTEFAEYAYDDVALPIACGQNASRPAALEYAQRACLVKLSIRGYLRPQIRFKYRGG